MSLAAYAAPCSALTAEQFRFLWLHDMRYQAVVKWRWLLGDTQLRAYTDAGNTATINRAALDQLIAAGLMERGVGIADVRITYAGRQAAK